MSSIVFVQHLDGTFFASHFGYGCALGLEMSQWRRELCGLDSRAKRHHLSFVQWDPEYLCVKEAMIRRTRPGPLSSGVVCSVFSATDGRGDVVTCCILGRWKIRAGVMVVAL